MDNLAKLAAAMHRDVERAQRSRLALHDAILAALSAGETQADIARATGYTRERLRQIAAAAKRST